MMLPDLVQDSKLTEPFGYYIFADRKFDIHHLEGHLRVGFYSERIAANTLSPRTQHKAAQILYGHVVLCLLRSCS